MPKFIDLSGQTFSRLSVISRQPSDSKRVKWLCACSCGNQVVVDANKLPSGHTRSCGCLQVELASIANLKHGQSSYPNNGRSTKEYNTWSLMHRRCSKKKSPDYQAYGGRGISVCERWKLFENFFADMGKAPSPKHSIDRIDVNGNYCPENCRWADSKTQRRNRRNARLLECSGRSLTPMEWSEISGICNKQIHARIKRGWPVERAIFEPIKR